MTIYQFLCLIGFPTMFVGGVSYIHTKMQKLRDENKAIRLGVQALLRGQMISEYNKWSERGYAPIWAKENFENVWNNYHNLGANGVMDNIHEKFIDLPTNPE